MTGNYRLVFAVTVLIGAVLVAIGLWAFWALWFPPPIPELTGTYLADDGGIYYVQRSSKTLWWAGMSLDSELPADLQWHRGLNFTNVFRGTINSDNTVIGEWADVTRGASLNGGMLTIRFGSSGGVTQLTRIAATGNFGATMWRKTDALDDTKFSGTTTDIISRFDQVRKNDGQAIHDNNLKPYRDQTVLYGRLVNTHLDYLKDNVVEPEIPHVNFGPPFPPFLPSFVRNFGKQDREFDSFACFHADDGDADFDMRLKVDLDKLEPEFYTTGWGDRTSGPQVFSIKLNDTTTRDKLGFAANEAYMGLEALMYGRPGTCDDGHPSPVNGGLSMLPGWADLFANSVLINGRPINGLFNNLGPPSPVCDFAQPCPFLNGFDGRNLFDIPAGIRLGDLLLSARGNGQIDANGNAAAGPGTYIRVTGTLVLDCGHSVHLGHPCFDDDPNGDPGDISGHQNQEIHPIYSIDVINFPYRPEDINVPGRKNLTGTYGGSDGSTYYVLQTGSTNILQPGKIIWWLGLMRDRQPMQRGTHFPIIGSKQLKPAFDANDPPCASGQCWAFANVFKGTITESPIETVIEGDWVGVPQSTSAGSAGGHMKFFVFNHKIIIPAMASIFPVTIEKMYEPPDTTVSQGTLTTGTR